MRMGRTAGRTRSGRRMGRRSSPMPGEHHDEHEHPLASEATGRQGYLDEAPAHPPALHELPDLHELHNLPIYDDHQLDTLDLHAHAHTHAYDAVDPTLRTR